MAEPREPLLGEIRDEREHRARTRLIEFGQRLERLAQQLQHQPEAVGVEMGELAMLFPAMVTEAGVLTGTTE